MIRAALRRFARWTRISAVLVCALATGALSWLAASDDALPWLAERIVRASQGRLEIDQPAGRLLGTMLAERVTVRGDGFELRVQRPRIDAGLLSLFKGALPIRALVADAVELDLQADNEPRKRMARPDSLRLALPLSLERLSIGRVSIRQGEQLTEFGRVDAAYSGGLLGHRIDIEHAQTPWGTVSGEATLGAGRPFKLEGTFEYRTDAPQRVRMRGILAGSLEAPQVTLQTQVVRFPEMEARLALAPFESRWLTRATMRLAAFDLSTIADGAPASALEIELHLASETADQLSGTLRIDNALSGPLSAQRAPLRRAESSLRIDLAQRQVHVEALDAALGAHGTISGTGRLDATGLHWDLKVDALDLRDVHAALHATALKGRLVIAATAQRQQLQFELTDADRAISGRLEHRDARLVIDKLHARAGASSVRGSLRLALDRTRRFDTRLEFRDFDSAAFGDWPAIRLAGNLEAQGTLAPTWQTTATLRLSGGAYRGQPVSGELSARIDADRIQDLVARLRVGRNALDATGAFGAPGDAIAFSVDARAPETFDSRVRGTLHAEGRIAGTRDRPQGRARIDGKNLRLLDRHTVDTLQANIEVRNGGDPQVTVTLEARAIRSATERLDQVSLSAQGTRASHRLSIDVKAPDVAASARLQGNWDGRTWRANLTELQTTGRVPIRLIDSATLELGAHRFAASGLSLRVLDGELAFESLLWDAGRLASKGRARRLPVAALLDLAGGIPGLSTDLRLRGDWAIEANPRLNGSLSLARESGDVVIEAEPRLTLGLDTLSVGARFKEDVITLSGTAVGKTLGSAGLAGTIQPGAGQVPGTLSTKAALDVRFDWDLATLAPLRHWIGGAAAVAGRLRAQLQARGTLAAPQLSGAATASALSVDVPKLGVALRDGTVNVRLADNRIVIENSSIKGPEGELTAEGTLDPAAPASLVRWRASRLRVFNRPDRELVVTGKGSVGLHDNTLVLRGELRADAGSIEVDLDTTERLGEDVVIVGAAPRPATEKSRSLPVDLDMTLDPGSKFRLRVAGLDTRLEGKLRIHTDAQGRLLARGTIQAVDGSYRVFGQKLVIERGRVHFNGPIDNPVLEVRALRKNQEVEAGVALTGSVRSPSVGLISEPPVPDPQKLAWLVLGRGGQSASAADLALLRAASTSLIGGSNAVPVGQRIANELGLDEVAVRGAGRGLAGEVVAFGKRLSDRLYFEFEQGLTATTNVIRLSYTLTRSISLRAEASPTSGGVGINFRRSYD